MISGYKARVLAIVNQKGGVGKSTTAINLSACLAESGYTVLLIDFDPQGNATSGLGMARTGKSHCIYNAVVGEDPLPKLIEETEWTNLYLVPASIQLAGAEIELVSVISRENRLKKAIKTVLGDFDYVIVDCPPSLGILTVNALAAADELIIPIQCEYYALEGLSKLLESVRLVKVNLNPDLEIAGVLMTMHDSRTKLSQEVVKEVVNFFQDKVYNAIIPRTVRLSEAPSFGQPIISYDSSSKGAQAYREFVKEVISHG